MMQMDCAQMMGGSRGTATMTQWDWCGSWLLPF
jgi:hypothetical protein